MADTPSELHAEIEKLERKHAEHPEGRYFVPLANAYRKLGDLGHAEALLREGLRRHPDYLSAHIVLGRCLADRDATEQAVEEFRYVLSLDAQNLIALRTLGELASSRGDAAEAARWYGELLSVDPMNEEARRALEALQAAPTTLEPEPEFLPGAGWWERSEEPAPDAPAEHAPVEEPATPEGLSATPATEQERAAAATEAARATADEFGGFYGGFLDLSDDDAEAPADAVEEGPEQVVTETIAELYARQGFRDRAAEVYRELIRRRGGDEALERRLAELEGQGQPAGAAEPDPTPVDAPLQVEHEALVLDEPPPAPPEAEPEPDDTFAASFMDGFNLDDPERPSASGDLEGWFSLDDEPVPVEALSLDDAMYQESAPDAPAGQAPAQQPAIPEVPAAEQVPAPATAPPAGQTVAEYLRSLIAWTPAAAEAPAPPPVEPDPAGATVQATEEQDADTAEAGDVAAETEERNRILDEVAEPLADMDGELWLEAPGDTAAHAAADVEPAATPARPEAAPGTGRAEEDAFPWELPTPAPELESQPEPESEPEPEAAAVEESAPAAEERGELFSFDAFFSEPAPAASAAEPTPPQSPPATDAEPAREGDGEDDDDLESFQAWLRSLKR